LIEAPKVSKSEIKVTLGLLSAVEENSQITQRIISKDLGVALGMVNLYLKRSIKKGYVKVSQAPANRYAYYLTPAGFVEKGRLTSVYLSSSFTFFRNARGQCAELLRTCDARGWKRLAFAGASDLGEILVLCAHEYEVEFVGVIDEVINQPSFMNIPVYRNFTSIDQIDAVIITDLHAPQAIYDKMVAEFMPDRIIAPNILCIVSDKSKVGN
jgi:hypothetical protein